MRLPCVLEFDSNWFGLRIGRYDIDPVSAARWADKKSLDCVYCLVPVAEIWRVKDATMQYGFRLVDVRVEFACDARKVTKQRGIRLATPEDSPWVERIARSAFTGTRFYNDRRFDRDLVDEMYANWIREAFARDIVFTTKESDGFVTMTKDGSIGLIAVDAERRQRGAGTSLMFAALNYAYVNDIPVVTVATQAGNTSAQRTFQKVGCRSTRTDLWLHRHRDDSDE